MIAGDLVMALIAPCIVRQAKFQATERGVFGQVIDTADDAAPQVDPVGGEG